MRAATCEGQEGGSGGARLLDPARAGQLAPVSAIELRPASRNDIASRHCVTTLRHEIAPRKLRNDIVRGE